MTDIGPELPPHLRAKRKHDSEDIIEESRDRSPTPPKKARRSPSVHEGTPRRVLGPAIPPAPLSERPLTGPTSDAESSSSDDDDDDFRPSLPPERGSAEQRAEIGRQNDLRDEFGAREAAKKPQREQWMLVPPKQDDWSSRVDPTKLRNRKFNTGKCSKAPARKDRGDDENALWTETPDQKRQRLEDEVMGVKKPAQLGPEDKTDKWKEQEAREAKMRIQEYNEKNRNSSLMNEHKKAVPKEKDDDPSARAFDKEKDMGLGRQIGHAQKKEMLTRAKDFGSRFAGGSYL